VSCFDLLECSLKYVNNEVILYSFMLNLLKPEEGENTTGDITKTTALLFQFRIWMLIEGRTSVHYPGVFMKRNC
jgi:hypothetical protein